MHTSLNVSTLPKQLLFVADVERVLLAPRAAQQRGSILFVFEIADCYDCKLRLF